MVNPLLTILFDVFLIGSAAIILSGMVAEYRASRAGAVGGGKVTAVPALHSLRSRRARRYSHRVGTGHGRRKLAA